MAVHLLVVILLMTPAFGTGAPEIVVHPSSVTVFNGNTAEFTCQTRNDHYAFWRLNGMIINYYDATLPPRVDVDTDDESVGSGVTSYKLTIRTRTEYHGLVFQCVAGVFGGGPVAESENATLMVQGLLPPVGDVSVENSCDFIILSWSPPYSLNVTGVKYNILYTIIISNRTDETPVPCPDCHNLTQSHYTFTTTNTTPCHKYSFTIISLNGAGEGGRSEPVEAFIGNENTTNSVTTQRSSNESGPLVIGAVIGGVFFLCLIITVTTVLVVIAVKYHHNSHHEPSTQLNLVYELHKPHKRPTQPLMKGIYLQTNPQYMKQCNK